jgi:hypothetical protein
MPDKFYGKLVNRPVRPLSAAPEYSHLTSGEYLFFVFGMVIAWLTLSKTGNRLQPIIVRPAVWPPLPFPNEIGRFAKQPIVAVIRCRHCSSPQQEPRQTATVSLKTVVNSSEGIRPEARRLERRAP